MQHEGWEEYEPDLIEAFRPDNDEGVSQYCRALRVANACEGDVIDVGAGDGFIANKIRERGHHVVAIDVSEKNYWNTLIIQQNHYQRLSAWQRRR
jgi:2-polyprenyl-3-methyl-5-hydroxy-6-metoxy-1,4-benzoquinol methylase